MNIKYHLANLAITSDPNEKSGRIDPRGTLDESVVLNKMLKRGTGLTKQEIMGVIDLYTDVVSEQVQSGFVVVTRLANFRPGIKGVFNSANDPFDSNRHHFHATISEGVVLRKQMREATGERNIAPAPLPTVSSYYDYARSTTNKWLTPGNIGKINGKQLKFEKSGKAEGIFFIRKDNQSETRVATLSTHTDGKLMFLIPTELASGNYTLEVRRSYTSASDIRIGRLNKTLTVK